MSDSTATLALLFDAPLQSWGDSSRFNHRGTAAFPSKSGVIGLISAALGIDKYAPDEADRIAPLSGLRFHVARLPRITSWGQARPSLQLRDYHTIGAAYDRNDGWEAGMILRNAEGKLKSVAGNPEQSHTEITERDYLLDSRFAVVLEGDASLLQAIEAALKNPVWGVWLGRKSCPPALPVRAFVAPSRDEAFALLIAALRRHEGRHNDTRRLRKMPIGSTSIGSKKSSSESTTNFSTTNPSPSVRENLFPAPFVTKPASPRNHRKSCHTRSP